MKPRSSTSSSEPAPGRGRVGARFARLPPALLLAVALVLAADALVFRVLSPWRAITDATHQWFYSALARDRLVVEWLGNERDEPRALLLGTSRLDRAWEPRRLDEPLPDAIGFYSIKHAMVYPPVIRAVADATRDRAPDVVLIGISEVDTHAPLELDHRTAFPESKLYFEAAREMGARWLFEQRTGLYRYGVGDVLVSYAQRHILGAAYFDRLRRFRARDRPDGPAFPDGADEQRIAAVLRAKGFEVDDPELQRALRYQIRKLGGVRSGPHARAQLAFIRRAIEDFRAAGSRVIVFELPVAPPAATLFGPELRGEFLAAARDWERALGARLIPLEEQPEYRTRDFTDLTHLRGRPAERATRMMLAAIEDELR